MIADAYVREAHAHYVRWGAEGKVRQLRRARPELEPQPAGPAAAVALRPEQLDRLSVIKASQTISSVMDQDLLSRTLLRFVLEEGGARRVVLVLVRDGELEIAAEARGDGTAVPVDDARVPRSLLSYVRRTQEPVLLDAAVDAGRFASDPYFADTQPARRCSACRSACGPRRSPCSTSRTIWSRARSPPSASSRSSCWRPRRRSRSRTRACSSASAPGGSRRRRPSSAGCCSARRPRWCRRRSTTRGVFGALARLCARSFADWAMIDLEEKGVMVRIAGAHRDPDKEPLLREVAVRYPPRPGSTSPVWQVLRTGEALELPVLADEQIRAGCVDEHHAELIRRLGMRSVVVVPLHVRDAVIGALSVVSATPNRFGRADVELAVELGRRIALAIDNARLLEATRRALHLREEFLGIASHELRTPLASLRLSAEALLRAAERKRAVSPEVLDRTLRRVLGNTARLEQLTAELLDVTRIEQGRLELAPVEIALDAIVRKAVEQIEPDLAESGSAVSIECAAPVVGRWDPSRLDQVVTNLVINAAKFGAGKPIEIRIDRAGDDARLAVIDHGIGIDPARRPFVFDRFERAVPSSSYGGLGLGLYITRSIVVAHGGTITVDSEPGVGSTFTVTLPCAAPAPAPKPAGHN